MKQTFERVEKHLFKRQYQTAGGDWSTNHYVRFTDWKGKRRIFPVGSDLKTAKDELTVYEARNVRREDFDLDRKKASAERLTVAKYIPRFLETKKGMPSYGFWKLCCGHIERLKGSLPLEEVTRSTMAE